MLLKSYYVDLQKQKEYDNIYAYFKGILKFKINFQEDETMKKMLVLGAILINSAILSASSLDDAAFSLYKGEVSEIVLKDTFSKGDFETIMEKFKKMKLQKAKQKAEKEKANALLKQRNAELQEEIRKIKDENSSKKLNAKRITTDEAVKNTFLGVYGDNPQRTKKLQELGFTSKEIKKIQQEVNKLVEQEKNKEKE